MRRRIGATRDPRRILLVRLSALGDVLLATPAARALRRRFPAAQIDWLIEESYAPLIAASPHVRPIVYRKRTLHAGLIGLMRLRRELERSRYDLIIDLQGKPKTWLLGGAAGRRLSFRRRTLSQAALALLGRDPPLTRSHAVDLYLEALLALGVKPDGRGLELALTAPMRAEAAGLDLKGPVAGLAPGARWATKRWPAERYAMLGRELSQRGFPLLLIGGPGDEGTLSAVRRELPGMAIADTMELSVGGVAAAIERCAVLVTGDSGPSHIAAALGTPVVTVFGPTSERRWGPLSERSRVVRVELPCRPCSNHGSASCPEGHHRCMLEVEVGAVLEAALELLGKESPEERQLTASGAAQDRSQFARAKSSDP
jgi:heptosyltransferase-2